ncbi:hypothetical protein [Bradyrhizobium sp. BR 10289]|uniref:hypothetical protein n=1 Tax=Bradyrhizobium sp. BR 10289 TaxID=2749993 RepID=UPI001C64D2A8|nr:hypothetical protein [Bradyrhizobium sp. BR 10289]MBW7973207.1 hypothetical protein [Bradyrhizobium sp. BR 10289]
MSASSRMKIIIPLVSAMSLLAASAQAQDAGPPRHDGQPGQGAAAPPQNMRKGPPPQQQAVRPAPQPGAPPQAGPGPRPHNAGGPPPGRNYARGPAPARDWGGHAYRGHLAWEGGRWRHEVHNGRSGWWWDVGGVWYYYPQRMEGPPSYISEDYYDDVPVAYAPAPPPVAYEPPPPPADPGASALGGAIVGGVLGGLISGNASGAAAGAVIGGATGAIAGATAASRPGYYLAQGNCYYRYPNGQYVQADPRACY